MTEIRAHSVPAADGVERAADAIVAATGFSVTDPPASHHIRGRDGRTLAEHWAGRPQAHKGTDDCRLSEPVHDARPPHRSGYTSVLLMIENQIGYLLDALRAMDERAIAAIEPRADAQAASRRLGAPARPRDRLGGRRLRELVPRRRRPLDPVADSQRRFRRELRRFDLTSYLARPYSSNSQ